VRGSCGSCWFDAARVACGEADEAVADHNIRVQLLRHGCWCDAAGMAEDTAGVAEACQALDDFRSECTA
jgi:hypothetical protein